MKGNSINNSDLLIVNNLCQGVVPHKMNQIY
jgi:hypothetical protein